MSSIKLGLIVIGSLLAFATSASADVRYAGSPKFGQFIVTDASIGAASEFVASGRSNPFDARAQMPASQASVHKGGIGGRGI
jgi:hypothetical protein